MAYIRLQEKWENVNGEETKKIEELKKASHYANAACKHVSQGIIALQFDGTIYMFNESAQKLLQVKLEEVLHKKIDAVLPLDLFGFSIKEALSFGLAPKLVYKTYREKLLEVSPIFLNEGSKEKQGLIILLKDISEIQGLQLQADQNERMKKLGEMVTRVTHEIRNPLGGIRGYAALLSRDLKNMPHLHEMAEFVIEGTRHLETLVNTVLQYARPISMQIQPVELGEFLRRLVKFIKADPAFSDSVQIQLHVPFRACVLSIDPDAMKSALLNLLFNAMQAMNSGGLLTIALLQREHSCQIEISDTGIGMEEEELKRLFTPFYTTKQKGNGLGLVEVQKIVQAHMGSIDVRSTPARGSTFTITLPKTR